MPAKKARGATKRKYKSGAQKRREKFEAAERNALAEQNKDGPAAAAPAPSVAAELDKPDDEQSSLEKQEREDYRRSNRPPDDVVGRMAWVQGLMAKVIYWSGRHIGSADLLVTRRTILEGGAKLGITAVKALYEERLKKLEATVYGKRRKGDVSEDGLEDLPS